MPWTFAGLVAIAACASCAGNDFEPTTTGTGAAGAAGGSGGSGGDTGVCTPGAIEACYTGPAGTEGVGACVAGTRTCEADGSGFGACVGEVTPSEEVCTTAADDDCDGVTDDGPGGCPCAPGETAPCYTGPEGTSGVGVCAEGVAECLADGSGFGACADEVVPAVESCGLLGDEDCDGSACSELDWALLAGDPSSQTGTAVAFDGAGNVLVAGRYLGSMNLGGPNLISDGTFDVFVAKLDPEGNHLWSKSFGAAGDQYVTGIGVLPGGDVVLTGYFNGAFSLGGTVLGSVGVYDGYLARLAGADGAHVWSVRFGDGGQTLPRALDVDIAGNTVVVGDHGLPAGCVLCTFNAFVHKYTPFGSPLYAVENSDPGDQRARDVALDPSGNAWVIGSFETTVSFGALLTSAGGTDVFVTKLDATGAHSQSLRFGNPSDQDGASIAVDAAGGPFLAGSFAGTIHFGGTTLASAGDRDFFLAHLTAGGAHLWSQRFGDAAAQQQLSVAYEGDELFIAGNLAGSADFGGGVLSSAGSDDIFLATFDAQGGFPGWSKSFGDASAQRVRGLAARPGRVAITGGVTGGVDLGEGALFSTGSDDAFVATFQR